MRLKTTLRVLLYGHSSFDWNKYWGSYNQPHHFGYSPGKTSEEEHIAAQFVTDTLQLSTSDTLLDVGCGDGVFDKLLPCNVVGVDFPEVMKHSLVSGFPGSITDIPIQQRYDKVLVMGTLHYVPQNETLAALRELRRVGNTGLLGLLPDKDKKEVILGTCPRENIRTWNNIQWFDRQTLIDLAKKVGFNPKIIETPSPIWQAKYTFNLILKS